MASLEERIYAQLPICLQNTAVTLRGLAIARRRYRRRYPEYVDKLMRSQWSTAEEFQRIQTCELRKLIKEAAENTPYYSKSLGKLTDDIDSLTLDDLPDIPFLEKSLLRTRTEEFLNKIRIKKYGSEEGHTSGTSGIPLVFPYDLDSMWLDMAFRQRQYIWAGITKMERSARFGGRILLGRHKGPPYWRYNAIEKQWFFSSYHITEETLPLYYEAIKKLELAYLDGYPSSLFNIAKWIVEQGLEGQWRPWVVLTTGETLMEYQREVIEKAFGCKLFDFYSSCEGAPFITQCPAGNLHVNPESGIVEFLRTDGTYAEPGEEAEMVLTSFFQRALPLIRYRIGDTGVLAENQNCPCGRKMSVVAYIAGREDDVLYSSVRGRIGSAGLSTALYKLPRRLKESQIAQVGEDSFVFRYIPNGEPLNEGEKTTILQELYGRLGSSVDIKVELVSEIPKGASGKSQLVLGLKHAQKARKLDAAQ